MLPRKATLVSSQLGFALPGLQQHITSGILTRMKIPVTRLHLMVWLRSVRSLHYSAGTSSTTTFSDHLKTLNLRLLNPKKSLPHDLLRLRDPHHENRSRKKNAI